MTYARKYKASPGEIQLSPIETSCNSHNKYKLNLSLTWEARMGGPEKSLL